MQVRINIWQLFDAKENVQGKVRADFFSVCFVPRTIRIAFHGLAGIPICFFGNLMEIFFPERKKSSTENLLTSRTIPVFATNGFTTTGSGIEFHSFASSPLSDLVTLKSDKSCKVPQMILNRKWSRDRKWSPEWTANDPRPQVIPKVDRKWSRENLRNGMDFMGLITKKDWL